MENIFRHVLQMSFYGSIAIVAVLILRRFFNKLPKKITCLFWLVPGLRLLCPFNFSTVFSVMNFTKLPERAEAKMGDVANTVFPKVSARPLPSLSEMNPVTTASHNQTVMAAFDPRIMMAFIWFAGIALILAYLIIKTVILLNVLKTAKRAPGKRYYESAAIDTSFVLGVIHPRIYMQSGLSEKEEAFILLHERTHIKYLDHITRIVGMLIVCLHWFNPFVWIAFSKLCADLEMRCDETVVEQMGARIRMEYCRSIVNHAMERDATSRGLSVAFSGDNFRGREIKMRVRNLISYKKVSTIAAALVAITAISLTAAVSTRAQADSSNAQAEDAAVATNAQAEDADVSTNTQAEENVAPATAVGAAEVMATTESTEPEEAPKRGEPVSVPGNILLDMPDDECLANYGKENFEIPADVVYSDEGRPYSKTYDYKTTPVLNKLGSIVEKAGFEILDPDLEFLDREGNVQVGRELYCFNAWKENGDETMLLNFYMVSKEYALDSFNEIEESDGLWFGKESCVMEDGNWYSSRVYDTKTGVMMDAEGTYDFDWDAIGLFD